MAEDELKKVEAETSPVAKPSPKEDPAEEKDSKQNPFEKALSPLPEEKISPTKPLKDAENQEVVEKRTANAKDRDVALARVETEKRVALIKAWEENEKTKADNKAYKKLSAIGAWENTKKASVESQLKQIEEKIEKKKAEYGEKMKNKMAEIHKAAEEKRAVVEAKRGEDVLKIEDTAAKFRSTGNTPKKLFGCFSC